MHLVAFLEGIAVTTEFRVERERRAWCGTAYRLQRRVFYGPLHEEVSIGLFRSKRALQLDALHACDGDSAQGYQHSQSAMYCLSAERNVIGSGSQEDRIIDERHIHRTRALASESEWLEDQVKTAGAKLTASHERRRQTGKSGKRVILR